MNLTPPKPHRLGTIRRGDRALGDASNVPPGMRGAGDGGYSPATIARLHLDLFRRVLAN